MNPLENGVGGGDVHDDRRRGGRDAALPAHRQPDVLFAQTLRTVPLPSPVRRGSGWDRVDETRRVRGERNLRGSGVARHVGNGRLHRVSARPGIDLRPESPVVLQKFPSPTPNITALALHGWSGAGPRGTRADTAPYQRTVIVGVLADRGHRAPDAGRDTAIPVAPAPRARTRPACRWSHQPGAHGDSIDPEPLRQGPRPGPTRSAAPRRFTTRSDEQLRRGRAPLPI